MRDLKLSLLCVIVSLVCFASNAFGQTPAPAPAPSLGITQQWSLQTSAVALPGGKSSIAGTDSGITFTPTSNFDIFDRNIISTDGTLKFFGGGFDYYLPALSVKLNNEATNTNFLRVRFAPTGSVGIAQIAGVNHYGFTAGFRADYMLTSTGTWTLGAKGEYVHFPEFAGKALVEVNASFHF